MLYFQAALLVALILGSSLPFTQAGPYGVNMESSICCNDFVPFPLPLKFLTRFHFTSATCRKHGVILLTMKNRKICADPRKGWVKHAITALKKNH
ncbi:C-C motif chemokine 22 isoform X1 [Phascolarctos cinereus]|uniref:C-C motif chemokine 22 isoform X2 n=1 Tax=Phascolarctos cinereus TaxID=38626 RepID=A0A6P5IS54_PHACI|nr:C-C motif chemokine 22 isoform X2 [Phascolarctos cinereus]